MRTAGVLVACVAGIGCEVGTVEIDDATLDRVASYHAMSRLNAQPYLSTLGPFKVNCFVEGDVADYRKLDPDRPGANVTMARGTMIVREVLDDAGQVSKLTVMTKGPPGYDPSLGDWWFAVTDPKGLPLEENGTLLVGRLAQCHDCHRERTRDDFLFGVPSAAHW